MYKFFAFLAYVILAALFAAVVCVTIKRLKRKNTVKADKLRQFPDMIKEEETQTSTTDEAAKEERPKQKNAIAVNLLEDNERRVSRIVIPIPASDELCSISGSAHKFKTDVVAVEVDGVVENVRAYTLPPLVHAAEVSRHHIFLFSDDEGKACFGVRAGRNAACIYTYSGWQPADPFVTYEIANGDRIKIGKQILEFAFVEPGIRRKIHVAHADAPMKKTVTKTYGVPEKKPGRAAANVGRFVPPEVFARFADRT